MKLLDRLRIILVFGMTMQLSCTDSISSPFNSVNAPSTITTSPGSLYVASGSCYGGGVSTSSGSSTVAEYNLATGEFVRVVADYTAFSTSDQVMGVSVYDEDNLLILIENGGGRRVDLVRKDGTQTSTYLSNATALNSIVRTMHLLPDSGLLISKTTAIERFSPSTSRVMQGGNSFVFNPAAPCSNSTNFITGIASLSNGKIIYTHSQGASDNLFGIISSTGYASAADCLGSQNSPVGTAFPTAIIAHSSGKVLVSYGSSTLSSNSIYSYDVDVNTNAISNATGAYTDSSIVNGPTSMAEDRSTGDVYVANGNANYNNIEKFTFNSATGLLTKVGTQSFIGASIFTRCVTGLQVDH